MLGPLRDALDGTFGDLEARLTEELTVAETNAERVLGLVDQLLDVARLDADGLRLRLRPLDLGEFVEQRVEGLQPLAERLGIDMLLHGPSDRMTVRGDPSQLGKVFDNLLTNALKFSPPEGTVDVTLDDTPDGVVKVLVRDRGPGIPEADLEKVFERFYQLQQSEERPGAGLGLTLARQLAELHGGTLDATNSREGPGACFVLALPRVVLAASPFTVEAPRGTESVDESPGWVAGEEGDGALPDPKIDPVSPSRPRVRWVVSGRISNVTYDP